MHHPIYIIGAGAVGKALAVFLQHEGKEVRLIRGRQTEGANESQCISVQLPGGVIIEEDLPVTSLSSYDHIEGTVVITTKSHGNAELANALFKKAATASLVILQNGIEVEKPFISEGFASVMRGVLFLSSQHTDTKTIQFKSVRPSEIGVIHGTANRLTGIVTALNTAPFPFIERSDIHPLIWKKTIINCVFNSICPLLETDNGIFHREKEVLETGLDIIREGIVIANMKGIDLREEDVIEQLLQISKSSDGQLISTLQDIRAYRPTEIETLNLAIARMGQEMKKQNLVPMNSILGKLVWWKSKLQTKNSKEDEKL